MQIKDKNTEDPKMLKKEIQKAIEERLLPLPEHPDQITKEIKAILPFALPIKHRSHTKGVVNALRKIFKFSELPAIYFVKLSPLPPHYSILKLDYTSYFQSHTDPYSST